MIVIEKRAKVFKVDDELFNDVKEFYAIWLKKNKSFSCFNVLGNLIVVKGSEEFVIPTDEDVKAILEAERENFYEEEVKKKKLLQSKQSTNS